MYVYLYLVDTLELPFYILIAKMKIFLENHNLSQPTTRASSVSSLTQLSQRSNSTGNQLDTASLSLKPPNTLSIGSSSSASTFTTGYYVDAYNLLCTVLDTDAYCLIHNCTNRHSNSSFLWNYLQVLHLTLMASRVRMQQQEDTRRISRCK